MLLMSLLTVKGQQIMSLKQKRLLEVGGRAEMNLFSC